MSFMLYPLLIIIIAALISLGLLFRLRKNHLLVSRPFYWHWALGFAIFGLVHLPELIINLGTRLSYQAYVVVCSLSIFVTLIAYLLFFRGTTLLLTKNKFWLNKLPIIILLSTAIFISLCFIFSVKIFILRTILYFCFIFPVNLYLAIIFLYLYGKGCQWDGYKKRPSTILLGISWISIFILDIVLWYILFSYSVDFWILKLASIKTWYLIRAAAHILILISFLVYTRCLTPPSDI